MGDETKNVIQKEMEFKFNEKRKEMFYLNSHQEKNMKDLEKLHFKVENKIAKKLEQETIIRELRKREEEFKLKIKNQEDEIANLKKQLEKFQNLQNQCHDDKIFNL